MAEGARPLRRAVVEQAAVGAGSLVVALALVVLAVLVDGPAALGWFAMTAAGFSAVAAMSWWLVVRGARDRATGRLPAAPRDAAVADPADTIRAAARAHAPGAVVAGLVAAVGHADIAAGIAAGYGASSALAAHAMRRAERASGRLVVRATRPSRFYEVEALP